MGRHALELILLLAFLAATIMTAIVHADVYQPIQPAQLPPGCYTTDQPLHCYEIPLGVGEVIIPNRNADNVKWYGGIMGGLLNQYFQLEWDVFEAQSETEKFRGRNRRLRKLVEFLRRSR